MKGYLITSKDCPPCEEIKSEYSEMIASGEMEVVDLDEDGVRAASMMEQYEVGIPGVVILSDGGKVVVKA